VSGGTGVTSFSPNLNTSTTYYAEARNTTTGCLSSSRTAVVATVNAVPAVPTSPSANARCGSGTVTFGATVPSGHTIDWYNASTGGSTVSGGAGVTSFSPNLNTTTTYSAQARNTTTGCVSSSRTAVVATVNAVPAVSITRSSSTVCTGASLTFTASGYGSASLKWSGSCTHTGSACTVSTSSAGTPSATVTATLSGCSASTSTSATVTTCGGVNYTPWTKPGDCSTIKEVSNNSSGYEGGDYMTWSKADELCRNSGGKLPTRAQLECMCDNKDSSPALPGGYVSNYYWSSTSDGSDRRYYVYFNSSCLVLYNVNFDNYYHYVKCVK
jgi:hypothetical protein